MSVLPAGVRVEVDFGAFDGGTVLLLDDATRGKLDTGTFGGALAFVDMTELVRDVRTQRGSSRFEGVYARAEAGTLEVVLDNRDARFDPTNLAGPYVSEGESLVRPMRAVRVRADGHDLWRGFADAWKLTYPPGDAVCVLSATDGTKVLANIDPDATAGAVEDAGARVNRILNLAGWPASGRDIDVGVSTLQAADIAAPLWTELLLTSDSEIGDLYLDGAGKVVFRNRHALLTDARSITAQAVFGDAPGELRYQELELAYDDLQLANAVRAARVGGAVQSANDAASQATYLTRTWERSDLLLSADTDVADYAGYVLNLLHQPELRFESMTVAPARDPDNLYPQVLGREIGDRITVRLRPPGRVDVLERDVIIRGIRHELGPERWRTSWTFQDASMFTTFFKFDSSTQGKLDTNRLAF